MTLEELQTEADKLGYKLVKKKPYQERYLPCICGNDEGRFKRGRDDDYFFRKCPNCGYIVRTHASGLESPNSAYETLLKTAWNKMVSGEDDEFEISEGSICHKIHKLLSKLQVYNADTIGEIPFDDGIYFVFERGEEYYETNRVVRVGTHIVEGRLKERLKDHFVRKSHQSSMFIRNIGRAFLNQNQDNYIELWNYSSKVKNPILKEEYKENANKAKEKELENRIHEYLTENMTFTAIRVNDKQERLWLEKAIISTLSSTYDFRPSKEWLGLDSPEFCVNSSGMWLTDGINGYKMDDEGYKVLRGLISETMNIG